MKTAEKLLQHNQQVPRYTSYPTAPHFTDAVTSDTVDGWIRALPSGDAVSLYIHIPFCRQMCWYCGCNTRATRQYAPIEKYLGTLMAEIDHVAALMGRRQPVSHIHFGGGSPSYLTPADFGRLMDRLREKFDILKDAEIAIEIDPRELGEAKIAAYASAGVNRASLGVQDFHEEVQRAVNRRQPFHVIYDAVHTLRDYGIAGISMDLLYGLPHQDVVMIEENVDFASALGPDRIALFGYAHVPWMKKHMRLIDEQVLPDGPERLAQFEAATSRLISRGYMAIGLDHFVRPSDPMAWAYAQGNLHRNFQGYTTDGASALIGLGASAISALPQGYAQNAPDVRGYDDAIGAGRLATIKGRALSSDDRIRRGIIEQLMCYFDVDLASVRARNDLPTDYFDQALERLAPLADDGLVTIEGSRITVNPDARQAVRLAAAAFDTYLKISPARHAQVA